MPKDCITVRPPDSLYKPIKWTGTEWITTLTPEEIEEIKNAPKETSSEEMNAIAIMELTELVMGGGV